MITECSTVSFETSLGRLSIRGTPRGILAVTFGVEETTEDSNLFPFLEQSACGMHYSKFLLVKR
ncbi:MAG: hypothetical protein Greene101449_404 [Candidatus Peregrinibacteria bacterium Greene1014_49]|nr:MAG: hypothetical protein Greene101449_404 [Candidatus Peregrinibacteria bacterium Greene1014_49]